MINIFKINEFIAKRRTDVFSEPGCNFNSKISIKKKNETQHK